MLVFPEQILGGRVPHRDFLHLYGPGAIYVLAAVYEALGTHLVVERLVGLAQHAAVAYSLWFLLRPFGRSIATAGAMVSVVVLIGPLGLSAMAWNGALALGLAALAVAARGLPPARGRLPAQPAGPGRVPGGHGPALPTRPRAGRGPGARRMVVPGAPGAAGAPGMGVRGHRAAVGAPPAALGPAGRLRGHVPRAGLRAPGRAVPARPPELGRGRRVPPAGGHPAHRAGGRCPCRGSHSRSASGSGWCRSPSFWWLVAAWRLRRREPGSDRALAYWPAALFGAALLQQAIQRPDTAHLSWVTGVTFALMHPGDRHAAGGGRTADARPARGRHGGSVSSPRSSSRVIPFYPVRTYVDLVGQSFGVNRFGFPIERRGPGRSPSATRTGAADAQAVVDELDRLAEPGDSLIIGPVDLSRANYSDAFFYHLFPDLEVGTRYIEMDPGLADAEDSGLAEEVAAARLVDPLGRLVRVVRAQRLRGLRLRRPQPGRRGPLLHRARRGDFQCCKGRCERLSG